MILETRTLNRRERIRTAMQKPEVREFYGTLVDLKQRGIKGAEVLIPETIIDMIRDDMALAGNIYGIVTVRRLKGSARVVMSEDTPEAIWLECCDTLDEINLDFSQITIECYKVGGYISVCNAILEDSFINIADQIQQQLSKAILKALDNAILNGDPLKKMPTGIIPSLDTSNKVMGSAKFEDIFSHFGEFPDDTENLTAVMNRKTYYNTFPNQVLLPTADGQLVMSQHNLPDGTPIIFTTKNNIPDNQMLIGDFSKYILAERSEIIMASSSNVRFIEDETVFKVTARYDGKPTSNDYFILFTINQ